MADAVSQDPFAALDRLPLPRSMDSFLSQPGVFEGLDTPDDLQLSQLPVLTPQSLENSTLSFLDRHSSQLDASLVPDLGDPQQQTPPSGPFFWAGSLSPLQPSFRSS